MHIVKRASVVVLMLFLAVLLGCSTQRTSNGPVEVVTETVQYTVGDAQLTGFWAYPKGAKGLPGVLVVHEWWGHNDYARTRAEKLAEQGYAAFALDMYGNGKLASHPKEANGFMMEVVGTDGLAQERFSAALDILKRSSITDDSRTAAIGYCFGGAVVISMARLGLDLDGVVSFHGSLQNLPPITGEVQAEFLVFNGEDDPFVSAEHITKFKQEMDATNMHYEFINYAGAVHGFTNPDATAVGDAYGLPLKYNAEADEKSWQQMLQFFSRKFHK